MNQILITNNNNFFYKNSNYENNRNKKGYLIVFVFSIIICIIIVFYLFNLFFSKLNQKAKSNIIKSKYNISTLYNSNSNYDVLKLSNDISIIGLIEIPKINVSYPIFENSNKNLLKISVCRFSRSSSKQNR